MSRVKGIPVAAIVCLVLMASVLLFQPFRPLGNRIGPGWGDILNGFAGFLFLFAAGISVLLAARARKR